MIDHLNKLRALAGRLAASLMLLAAIAVAGPAGQFCGCADCNVAETAEAAAPPCCAHHPAPESSASLSKPTCQCCLDAADADLQSEPVCVQTDLPQPLDRPALSPSPWLAFSYALPVDANDHVLPPARPPPEHTYRLHCVSLT